MAAVARAGWFSLSLGAWLPSAAPDYRRRRRRPAPPESYVLFRFSSPSGLARPAAISERSCGRRGAGELSEFRYGVFANAGIERSAVGFRVPLLSPTSRAKHRRQQTDPHPPPGRRGGCWPMSPWRDGSSLSLGAWVRAPRRIMPELAATAPAIRATRSSRLDGAAAAGRTMVRSTSAAVAGFVSTIDIAGRTSRVLLSLSDSARARGAARQSSSGANAGARAFGANDHAGRRGAGRALGGRGSSTTAPIESALPGRPCASSLSHFSRQIRRQQTDPHPPPGRRCGCWPMSPWRDGSSLSLGAWASAAPDHARAGGHGARDQSDPLEPTGRRGGGWPNDGEVDVGGCRRFRLTIDIAGRTSRVLLLSLIPRARGARRGNPVRGRTLELGRSERTIMPAAAAPGARWI